jgi:hypothetical protein
MDKFTKIGILKDGRSIFHILGGGLAVEEDHRYLVKPSDALMREIGRMIDDLAGPIDTVTLRCCVYHYDDAGRWNSGCHFQFMTSTPMLNGSDFKYCPFCGKRVLVHPRSLLPPDLEEKGAPV